MPVGRLLGEPPPLPGPPAGSAIVLVATDAAVGTHELRRLARRAGLGLGRTGSHAAHGSGEIALALSTAEVGAAPLPGRALDPLFAAVVDATEEAVLNALWAAPDVTGHGGFTARGLPHEPVLALLAAHGRLP